jgi:hypothetical protein
LALDSYIRRTSKKKRQPPDKDGKLSTQIIEHGVASLHEANRIGNLKWDRRLVTIGSDKRCRQVNWIRGTVEIL